MTILKFGKLISCNRHIYSCHAPLCLFFGVAVALGVGLKPWLRSCWITYLLRLRCSEAPGLSLGESEATVCVLFSTAYVGTVAAYLVRFYIARLSPCIENSRPWQFQNSENRFCNCHILLGVWWGWVWAAALFGVMLDNGI